MFSPNPYRLAHLFHAPFQPPVLRQTLGLHILKPHCSSLIITSVTRSPEHLYTHFSRFYLYAPILFRSSLSFKSVKIWVLRTAASSLILSLKSLSLLNVGSMSVRESIRAVGHQLTHLHVFCKGLDLPVILEFCPDLTSLTLEGPYVSAPYEVSPPASLR